MKTIKLVVKWTRRIIGLPFILVATLFMKIAELISGEVLTYNAHLVQRQMLSIQRQHGTVRKGFRTPKLPR